MAKAGGESTEWAWLSQAYQRALASERAADLAERHLMEALNDGRLSHQIELIVIGRLSPREKFRRRIAEGYWRSPTVTQVVWAEDRAEGWLNKQRAFYYRIKVNLAELQQLYPEAGKVLHLQPRRGPHSSAPLVLAEAETRLQGKDSRVHIQKGRKEFLEGLANWLSGTHPKAKPMAAKTIGDHLRDDARVRALLPPEWLRRK